MRNFYEKRDKVASDEFGKIKDHITKIRLEKKYTLIAFYVLMTLFLGYIGYLIVENIIIDYLFVGLVNTFRKIIKAFQPLLIGIIIAYILYPLMNFYEKKLKELEHNFWKKNARLIATLGAVFTLVFIILAFIYGAYLMIGGSVGQFDLSNIDEIIKNISKSLSDTFGEFSRIFGMQVGVENAFSGVNDFINGIFAGFLKFINSLVTLIISIVFAVFILLDHEYLRALLINLRRLIFGREKFTDRGLLAEIDLVLRRYIRVIFYDLTILAILTSFGLAIIGLPYSIILGIFASYTNIIPYIGSIIGAIPAFIIGLAYGDLGYAIFVFIYLLAVQQVHISFISPKIQADGNHVNPVFILLGLSVFGALWGIWGLIVAIPLTAVIQAMIIRLVNYIVQKRKVKLIDLEEVRKNKA